jgi:hypothetical protein
MTRIYNYMFHYNPYEELWYAIPRDKYVAYWSGEREDGILFALSIDNLIEIIDNAGTDL